MNNEIMKQFENIDLPNKYQNLSEWNEVKFEILKGKILIAIEKVEKKDGDEFIVFKDFENNIYAMGHIQDCCESVTIEDICGELKWLLNTPILLAEERDNKEIKNNDYSQTWTFYEISTINGSVTIRWFGASNGYYSETVSFFQKKGNK